MTRPKRMSARVAFYIPPGVKELVAQIKDLRTARHGGLEAREADIYREAIVRGLPLVLAAEKGEVPPMGAGMPGRKAAARPRRPA